MSGSLVSVFRCWNIWNALAKCFDLLMAISDWSVLQHRYFEKHIQKTAKVSVNGEWQHKNDLHYHFNVNVWFNCQNCIFACKHSGIKYIVRKRTFTNENDAFEKVKKTIRIWINIYSINNLIYVVDRNSKYFKWFSWRFLFYFHGGNDRRMAETSKRTTNNSASKSRKSKNDIIRTTLGTYLKQKNYSVSVECMSFPHFRSTFEWIQFMFDAHLTSTKKKNHNIC